MEELDSQGRLPKLSCLIVFLEFVRNTIGVSQLIGCIGFNVVLVTVPSENLYNRFGLIKKSLSQSHRVNCPLRSKLMTLNGDICFCDDVSSGARTIWTMQHEPVLRLKGSFVLNLMLEDLLTSW